MKAGIVIAYRNCSSEGFDVTDEGFWPRKIGRGWNTSDGYRFFNEVKAEAHQQRVDEREGGEGGDS